MLPTGDKKRTAGYLAGLMAVLCTASFFEGFDFFIVSLIIDLLAKDFHVTNEAVLKGVSLINVGAILGFFLIWFGDWFGRKPIFLAGVAGYGALSILTAICPGFHTYVALQFLTKIFLVTEFNIAIVIVSEEYPAKVRGTAVAVLEVAAGLGGGLAMMLSKHVLPEHGWRAMYMIGGAPLLLIPAVLFFIKETRHFEALRAGGAAVKRRLELPWRIWTTPSRRNALIVGSLWFLCYICYAGLIYHWVLFAKTERGWSEKMIGTPMLIATILGMLGYLVSGVFLDWIGRRKTGMLFFSGSAAALVWVFSATGSMMMPSLVAAMFFVFALLPICSTYNAEMFPTELRANASAWCNFLMGRPAQVLAPFIVATLSVAVGGIGNAVRFLAIGPLAAVIVIFLFLPETKGVKMDEVK